MAAALPLMGHAAPFGSTFTYQGRLDFSGAPAADGLYDFQFTLHDAATLGTTIGSVVTISAIGVTNGLFTTELDFGASTFTSGEVRWLQLEVNTNGATPLVTLKPRQRIAPTPQAIYAGNAGTATTVTAGAVTSAGIAPSAVDSESIQNGSIETADLSPSLFNGTFWKLTGNTGPGNFLGSVDNQPVEFRANNQPALRLLPNATSPNLVGGFAANFVNPDAFGAFIGGGGSADNSNVANGNYVAVVGGYQNSAVGVGAFIGGGSTNRATANASFVGGGTKNRAVNDYSTVAGGNNNWASAPFSTIAGGNFNTAEGANSIIAGGFGNAAIADAAFIGGGFANWNSGDRAVLAGGESNTVTNDYAAVGGGLGNFAGGRNAVIAGGYNNTNTGAYSTLGGGNSHALRSSYSTIGGGRSNSIPGTLDSGVTIGGGVENLASGSFGTIGGGRRNVVTFPANDGVIGGGKRNIISTGSTPSISGTIAGGETNRIHDSAWATISGGINNTIDTFGTASSIGGGSGNTIESGAGSSIIAGGFHNRVAPLAGFTSGGSIGGGSSNEVRGSYASVPGGLLNVAAGAFSQAAGRRAKANHNGSLVWADDTDADFASTTNKQFAVRANNGVMIQSSTTALDLRGGGAVRVAGAGINTATPIFTHRATAANITGSETRISHPHCDGKPGAILIVTYNFNPAGLAGTRNDRPVGIYYTGTQWAIYNLDAAAMPVGAAYNVLVANP